MDKYIKLYNDLSQKRFEKSGYYYPMRTWAEFENWNNDSFEERLKDEKSENTVLKAGRYISLLRLLDDFGYFLAFEKRDFNILNNVIFQNSRRRSLHRSFMGSNADHCNLLWPQLGAFACNDFVGINAFLPEKLPLSKGRYYAEVSVNLLKVMYYKQDEFAELAVEKANTFMTRKTSALEKYVVKYFLALYRRDVEEINLCLEELCRAYQRQSPPVDKKDKCFGLEIHGLYRFARHIDEDFFLQIQRPKHPCFFEEFELWQQENDYPTGRLFYAYPEHLDYMNKIFAAKIPTITLTERNGKFSLDGDTFLSNLTAQVESVL